MLNRSVTTRDLFHCDTPYLRELFETSIYPWEMLPKISGWISSLLASGIPGYREWAPGILVGEDVVVAPTATVEAPAILGHRTTLRPGAFLRGNVIVGCDCVIGNSSELKHCILLDSVQVPHYNYVGDSVLGNHSHLGAGAVCSNLKSDGRPVVVHGEVSYETGLRKVGGFLGDFSDVGCGCVLNPGTVLGKHTSVYPLTALRGVYPAGCIVKDPHTVVLRTKR